jgi:hypothetical protein
VKGVGSSGAGDGNLHTGKGTKEEMARMGRLASRTHCLVKAACTTKNHTDGEMANADLISSTKECPNCLIFTKRYA